MRLLKSVFLTAAFCAFTVTSFAQSMPRGPAASNTPLDTLSRGGMWDKAQAPAYSGKLGTGYCSDERNAIKIKDALIAELKKELGELQNTGSPLAKKGAGR